LALSQWQTVSTPQVLLEGIGFNWGVIAGMFIFIIGRHLMMSRFFVLSFFIFASSQTIIKQQVI
jgi:hypothetical protein